jgi:putative membrane protein
MKRYPSRHWIVASAAFLSGPDAAAHGTAAAWTFDAWVVLPLVISAVWFVVGAWRLALRSEAPARRGRQITWFTLGWLVLAGALLSPLHAAGERSFTAHMLEHELLMLVAAPLLVLGRPMGILLWALPHRWRLALSEVTRRLAFARTWHALSAPITATTLQLAAMWLWHAPVLFDRALRSDGWHIAQHLSFVVTALLFWHALLRRPRAGVAVACLFVTAMISGALGSLMALSASPWYAGYAALGMTPYGLTPAEDQQLAGVLMWVPGGLLHAIVALLLLRRILQDRTTPQAWRTDLAAPLADAPSQIRTEP